MPEQLAMFKPEEFVQRGDWKPPGSLPVIRGKYDRIGFDVESTGKNKRKDRAVGYAVATPDGQRYYIPFAHLGGGNLDPVMVKRWANQELRDVKLIGLNIGYDAELTAQEGVDLEGHGCRLHDVAHAAALLNEYRYGGFNLNDVGLEYVGRGKEPCPVNPADLHKVHSSLAGPYAEGDAALALDVHEAQRPLIEKDGLTRVQDLEDQLIWVNNHIERNGARLDKAKLLRWCEETRRRFGDAILEIHRLTGLRVNPNSSQDLDKLYRHLGLENTNKTEHGDPSFTKEFLTKATHPVVKLAVEARQIASIRSKYLDKYRKAIGDGETLYFSLYQLRAGEDDFGTVAGRYSCANVNLQQVFKAERQEEEMGGLYIIRELFISDEGFDLCSADASQIEFRLFAHYSNSRKLIGAYRDNPRQDFHQLVADLFHQPRYQAKNNNFGKLYGMGRRKTCVRLGFACVCGCPDQEFWNNDRHAAGCPAIKGNDIIDQYDAEFPEAKRLMRTAMNLAETRGFVKTLLGRMARFPDKQRLYSALNRVIQGSAADLFKMKMLRVYQERAALGIHKLRVPVHDETTSDTERGEKYDRLREECYAAQDMELKVPILWDLTYGKNWREAA